MTKTAILFPGQGAQAQGMALSFFDKFHYARLAFFEASESLGYDCYKMIQDNVDGKLDQTQYTQPLLLLAGAVCFEACYRELNIEPDFVAGHSLGEYTALVASGALSVLDAVRIVAKRGELMQRAVPEGAGAMAAVIGMADEDLEALCASVEGYVTCANYNSPGQIVISGESAAVDAVVAQAKPKGAKLAKRLPVSVPSHCHLMKSITDEFEAFLNLFHFGKMRCPVIDNVDAKPYQEEEALKKLLVQQLYSPVLWTQSITHLFEEQGVTRMIECGPGKVLTGLNKRINKSIETHAVSEVEHLELIGGKS